MASLTLSFRPNPKFGRQLAQRILSAFPELSPRQRRLAAKQLARQIDQSMQRIAARYPEPTSCKYEVPGFGPCDAQLCGRRAVANSVELQIPVCHSHLAEVEAM
jgi:hypothetical protein